MSARTIAPVPVTVFRFDRQVSEPWVTEIEVLESAPDRAPKLSGSLGIPGFELLNLLAD
jgi:hypothetical protein